MALEKTKISTYLDVIEKEQYVLPHFQRYFEWSPRDIEDLFKSIIQGLYAGNVLLWGLSDKDRGLKMWDPIWSKGSFKKPTLAIIDGQQRLTSVHYAIMIPKKKFNNRKTFYQFYIDFDAFFNKEYDDCIRSYFTKSHRTRDNLIEEIVKDSVLTKYGLFPLGLIYDEKFKKSNDYKNAIEDYLKQRQSSKDRQIKAVFSKINSFDVNKVIQDILDFTFTTETFESAKINEICVIFANLNSKGRPLTTFDLMNSFLYPHSIQLRKIWDDLANPRLKEVPKMELFLLKLISLHKQSYCSTKFIYNLVPHQKIKVRDKSGKIIEKVLIKKKEEFIKLWGASHKYSIKALNKIMNSGTKDFGAIKIKYLPNTTIVPLLGAIMFYIDLDKNLQLDKCWDKIYLWYWSAVFSGEFSGSSDSIMARDYKQVLDFLRHSKNIPITITEAKNVVKDLDLYGVSSGADYSAILCLLALEQSKDFYSGRLLGSYDVNKIQDHHIFPVKIKGIKMDKSKIHCILNRTLIIDETNNKIKNKKPSEYLKEVQKKFKSEKKVKEILKTHLISDKAYECMKKNDFGGFLEARKRTLIQKIKEKLGM